jgi:hypothetical protein
MKKEKVLPQPVMETYSVESFCQAHGICKGHFYNLLSDGLGPNIIKLGRRTLISKEAATDWRKKMEQQSTPVAA